MFGTLRGLFKLVSAAVTVVLAWLLAHLLLFVLPFFLIPIVIALDLDLPFKLPFPGACLSETVRTEKRAGVLLELVDTNCDLIAKDEAITLFATRGPHLVDWLSRTQIFEYDGDPAALTIASPDQGTLLLSIDRISSVYFARDRWRGLRIVYDIGHISYPSASDPQIR